jgi:hypothetical protein
MLQPIRINPAKKKKKKLLELNKFHLRYKVYIQYNDFDDTAIQTSFVIELNSIKTIGMSH